MGVLLFVWIWQVDEEVDEVAEQIEVHQLIVALCDFCQQHFLCVHELSPNVARVGFPTNSSELRDRDFVFAGEILAVEKLVPEVDHDPEVKASLRPESDPIIR